jgi:hypothetical protein
MEKIPVLDRRIMIGLGVATLFSGPALAQKANGLPDGETARAGGVVARLIDPTLRYTHAVLGDAVEAGGFSARIHGQTNVFTLGEDAVFEDRRVRLWDVDGDGKPEAVIIKSYLATGAAIAIYRLGRNGIAPLAEGPAIGTRNRWLNLVGFADFAGAGEKLIAAVITPHLSGSLRLYRLTGNSLNEVARMDGFTNHIIGSRDLDLARVVSTGKKARIVIPTIDRRSLALLSFDQNKGAVLQQEATPSRIARVLEATAQKARIMLEDGQEITVNWR